MTTTEPTTELTPEALATWARLRDVQNRILELAEQEIQLKTALREHLGRGAFTVGGQIAFTITPSRRFDPAAAEAMLTPAELDACQVSVLDRQKVQQTVSPERYAAMQREVGLLTVRAAR